MNANANLHLFFGRGDKYGLVSRVWKPRRGLIQVQMTIFINSHLKHVAIGFPIVLLQDVLVLLQDALFYYRKQAEILGDGREGRMKYGKGI